MNKKNIIILISVIAVSFTLGYFTSSAVNTVKKFPEIMYPPINHQAYMDIGVIRSLMFQMQKEITEIKNELEKINNPILHEELDISDLINLISD